MLFYPVHFRGVRAPWIQALARMMPYRLRQIPGIMVGGIGWQGIVPSRAAKMGSLAVDAGIAKLGTPGEYWHQFEPDRMAEQIVESTREDTYEMIERIMSREHPRLWADLPAAFKDMIHN